MIKLEELWSWMLCVLLLGLFLKVPWLALMGFVGMCLSMLFNDRLDGPFGEFEPDKVFKDKDKFLFQVLGEDNIKYVYPETYRSREAALRAQKRFCGKVRSWNHLL